eukprot:811437_1
MSDEDDQRLKTTVDVGSGDFQPNPIYGDAPPSYAGGSTYDNSPNMQQQQQPQGDDNYEYPANNQQEDDDANNPFNENEQQQQYEDEDLDDDDNDNDNNYDNNDNNNYDNETEQNPPPPYSEDPPAPPPAFADNNTQNDNDYDNEPEDVVGQMNHEDEDVGDYGVTQPKVDTDTAQNENGIGLFGNFFIRTIYIASSLFFASMMAFALWFRKSDGDFSAGWGLSGFAAFMLFLGSGMAIGFAIMKKLGRPIPFEKWILWSIIGIYVTGGLFYFLGGCAVAYAWNTIDGSYIGGIFFAEQTFVGLHGIVAGVDLWKREILNNKKWRVIIYNTAFLTLSIIAFFAFAITSTKFDSVGADNAGPAFLALFYFLVLIPEILYLVIYLIPKLNETLGKPIVLLILAGSYLICVVCILIGYFIIVGDFGGFQGRAYWVGVGFFVMLMGTIIAFDMLFDRFIPGYKDGGQSVTDQQVNGDFNGDSAAVATIDPDMNDDINEANVDYDT